MTATKNRTETRGRKSLFGQKLTDTERNRRSRQRRKIQRDTAKECGLTPVSVYLPDRIVQRIKECQAEQADNQASVEQAIFTMLREWIESQPESIREHINMTERAAMLAAERIEQEGL